ncbi:MAG: hypothetical protein M0R77_08080 [Gammaproteobacteria bacterium]|nr:hypothetical protein [Gammaproteobacteria bacterium]
MALAIKFGDLTDTTSVSGAIYFDAVTEYKKNYSGRVTDHPIEAGASVSDHYISNNPKIQIAGVISSVDFSNIPSQLILDGDPVINNNDQPSAVSVGGLGGKLRQFLPGVVTQFLPQVNPSVSVDQSERTDHKDTIDQLMKELMNGLYYDTQKGKWVNRMTPITLFDVFGGFPFPVMQDLIVVKFSSEESVENGDALVFNMELEQVRFVSLESADAPNPQNNTPTQRATTPTKEKGNVPSTPSSTSQSPRPDVMSNVGRATN